MEKRMTLRTVLTQIETFEWSDALFLPENETWSLETQGAVLDPDDVEDDEDEVPKFAKDHDLMYALDIQTIQGIVENAYEQKSDCTDQELFEAFTYYYDHDAFTVMK